MLFLYSGVACVKCLTSYGISTKLKIWYLNHMHQVLLLIDIILFFSFALYDKFIEFLTVYVSKTIFLTLYNVRIYIDLTNVTLFGKISDNMTSSSILIKLRGFDMKLYYIELDASDKLADAENILKSSYPTDFKETDTIQFKGIQNEAKDPIWFPKQTLIKDLQYKDSIMISCKIPNINESDKEEEPNNTNEETEQPVKGKTKKSKAKKTE